MQPIIVVCLSAIFVNVAMSSGNLIQSITLSFIFTPEAYIFEKPSVKLFDTKITSTSRAGAHGTETAATVFNVYIKPVHPNCPPPRPDSQHTNI